MKVLLNAFREAVRGRNMVKAKALNKVEKFCQKRGLNVGDTFEQAVKNVKDRSGEYTKNPIKKLYRFVKEFVKLAKNKLAKKRLLKSNQRRETMQQWLERTATEKPNPAAKPATDLAQDVK